MAARSLNRVQLIGNLTRDPELRYTPQGTAVATFGVATNREWTTESGEKRDEADFHNVVAWNKLAELCSQLLTKGTKVYVEGRLSTRAWTGQDGVQRKTTEVVISDMIILSPKKSGGEGDYSQDPGPQEDSSEGMASAQEDMDAPEVKEEKGQKVREKKKTEEKKADIGADEINPDDIPF